MKDLAFRHSAPFTLGVELELQLLNRRTHDLTGAAADLLNLIGRREHAGDIKPEITQSMLEISTSIHTAHTALLQELYAIRTVILAQADRLNLAVSGGGAHPFQHWSERRIYAAPRFEHLNQLYGYLAKQFTVFGQHVHVGCVSGDVAIELAHLMSRFVPQFIALAASSPFFQGVDTAFESSRLSAVSAFPLSGHLPFVHGWDAFLEYFESMRALGVVESMKDFYWDIRPKPEFGTIELRVCDTPLSLARAAALAIYAQTLARWLLEARPLAPSADVYRVYGYNRFLACRFGLSAEIIDPYARRRLALGEDVADTIDAVLPFAQDEAAREALLSLQDDARRRRTDSGWLREQYAQTESLPEVVRRQAERWAQAG